MYKLLTAIMLFSGAGAIGQSLNDGPYIFYKGDKMIRDWMENGQFYRDSLRGSKNKGVWVRFPGHPDWNFSVQLKDKLANEPCLFEHPERLLVLSDIEGEFGAFRSLLIVNKVIDKKYNWTFGKGHLVIDGDLFDRGNNVTEYLWLLYKLEQSAAKAGGYVHTILGNHDIMNLSGDLRYVQPKYLEAAKKMGREYSELFSTDTELGRWLRTKNIVERIGDKLFMHAGMAPEILSLQLSVQDINEKCRPYFATKRAEIPADMQVFFGKSSPFWYRGYFMQPRVSVATIDSTLAQYRCSQIIVGHTILDRNIALYYGGKVLAVDVDAHAGERAAALWEKGQWWLVDDKGKKKVLQYLPENDQIKDEDIL